MSSYATDLPGIEPAPADLHAMDQWDWDEAQAHLEELLAEQSLTEIRRSVAAPMVQLATPAEPNESERRAA